MAYHVTKDNHVFSDWSDCGRRIEDCLYRLQRSCCVSVIAASEKQSGKTGVANLSLDNERG